LERLALIVTSLAIVCLTAEAMVRLQTIAGPAPPPPNPDPPLVGPPAPVKGILDVLRPGSTGVFQDIEYTLNKAGVRGPEYAAWPEPGVFRIVVIGDSVTMGHGVRVEDAYPALIEAALNASSDTQRYEVINLGLSNLNLAAAVNRLETIGASYHPALVVYGFTMNDIETPEYRRTAQGPAGVEYQNYVWRFSHSHSALLRVLWRRFAELREILLRPRGSYVYELYDNYFDNPPLWALFDRNLERIAQFATARAICTHVLIHTHVVHMNFRNPFIPIYERVAAAAEHHGMTVTRSLPLFRGRDERALQVSPLDPHPNAQGHQLHAQALLQGLAALPLRCWGTEIYSR
jgi:lysophospholipase L1-like esterase